jgi:hypothetical protein
MGKVFVMKIKILCLTLSLFSVLLIPGCSDTINYESGEGQQDILYIFPNPSSTELVVGFSLWIESEVSLYILDIYGRIAVEPMADKMLVQGEHQYSVNLQLLPVGIYSCILEVNGQKYIEDFTVMR